MACLYLLLAIQYGTVCSYYLHPNMYVCIMYVCMYDHLRT